MPQCVPASAQSVQLLTGGCSARPGPAYCHVVAEPVSADDVRELYREGVRAVGAATAELSPDQWDTPVCGAWSSTLTMRHLVAVAGWYHLWLDRAQNGELSRPFSGADIDARTHAELARHDDLDGDDAVVVFTESATAYLERVRLDWDRPYSYPFGTVTAGLHAGIAATEWHLHAWDLSGPSGERHTPARPDRLMLAAGRAVAAADGGVRGAVTRRVLPLVARRAPWETLLRRSGRI